MESTSTIDIVASKTLKKLLNKAEYTAFLVACRWTGAVIEIVTGAFGQEQ